MGEKLIYHINGRRRDKVIIKKIRRKMKKYVMITGASYGIGEALAYKSAEEGYDLILIARSGEKLQEIKSKILKERNIKIITIKCDLSDINQIMEMENVIKKYDIDILINNAGFGYYCLVKNQDLKNINNMIDLNIKALTYLSTYFVKKYVDNESKKYLMNISSTGGYVNVPNAVTYCATKFYVSAFTEGLSKELENSNSKLSVKNFAPSVTETKFGEVASGNKDYQYDKIFKKYNTAQEIAEYVYKLIYSDNSVGYIDRKKYNFEMTDIKFPYDNSRLKKINRD